MSGLWLAGRSSAHDRWVVSSGTAPVDRGTHQPAPPGVVGRALGRAEARLLRSSPWLWAGFGICVLGVVTADLTSSLNQAASQVMFEAHPLIGMAIIASHRAATRSARDSTDELFDTCPSPARTRSIGVLWSAIVPATMLGLFASAYVAVIALRGNGQAWTTPVVSSMELVSVLVMGVGGVALGAAMGRWIRFPLAPVFAIVAIGYVSLRLGATTASEFETRMLFSTFGPISEGFITLTVPQAATHLAWLASLTILTILIALAPRRS